MKMKNNNQMKTSNLLEKLLKKSQLELHSIVSFYKLYFKFKNKDPPLPFPTKKFDPDDKKE